MCGVSHSLHSPLMSITNTILGMTKVDRILQLGDELLSYTIPQALATIAVTLSTVNLVGGFLVTHKMLEMFRKKDIPPEYWHCVIITPEYWHCAIITPVITIGDVGMFSLVGVASSNLTSTLSLASGTWMCC